ncbi:hypothetical protein FQA39_LY19113 [Lamprigera yunnana]|nr:hypothetical protein FQA39_LY19113 [Lamprigera yunnana]
MDFSSDDSYDDPNFHPSDTDESDSDDSDDELFLRAPPSVPSPTFSDDNHQPCLSTAPNERELVENQLKNLIWEMSKEDIQFSLNLLAEYARGMKEIYKCNSVDETNLYATQILTGGQDISQRSRLHQWQPVDKAEMYRFLALVGWMGLVKVPVLRDFFLANVGQPKPAQFFFG